MEYPVCFSIVSSSLGISIGRKYSEELGGLVNSEVVFLKMVSDYNIENIPKCTVHVSLVVTGGTEHIVSAIAEKSEYTYILYIERYNSLPAVVESIAYLRKKGLKYGVELYKTPQQVQEILSRLKKVAEAYNKVKNCRFGLIGGISPWLIYSNTSTEIIRKRGLGELIYIPMEKIYEEYGKQKADVELLNNIIKGAVRIELSNLHDNLTNALKVYNVLQEIIREYKLCGLTIKCFDLIKEKNTTACVALSLLNTNLIPAACEGDIPLLYSMVLGTYTTGKPVFMGNPISIRENEVVIAHCTSWLAGKYSLYTHFESDTGVGIRVDYPLGEKATIYRLNSELDTLRIGVGEIVEHDWSRYQCRTQVKLKINNAMKILTESIGNHYALIIGDHTRELVDIANLLGFEIEYL